MLGAGTVIEFDAPHVLLKTAGGAFRGLAEESGDLQALHAAATKPEAALASSRDSITN